MGESDEKPKKKPIGQTRANFDELDKKIKTEHKKLMGAPEFPYSDEIAEMICFDVATTPKRIKEILDDNPLYPKERTFYKWLLNRPKFSQMYNEAKRQQQDVKLDYQREVLERARESTYFDQQGNSRIDAPAIALAKLECDNIKWEAARLARRKYGTIEVELTADKEAADNVRKMLEKAKSKKHDRDY